MCSMLPLHVNWRLLETDIVFCSVITILLFKLNFGAHKKQFIRVTAEICITQMLNRQLIFPEVSFAVGLMLERKRWTEEMQRKLI